MTLFRLGEEASNSRQLYIFSFLWRCVREPLSCWEWTGKTYLFTLDKEKVCIPMQLCLKTQRSLKASYSPWVWLVSVPCFPLSGSAGPPCPVLNGIFDGETQSVPPAMLNWTEPPWVVTFLQPPRRQTSTRLIWTDECTSLGVPHVASCFKCLSFQLYISVQFRLLNCLQVVECVGCFAGNNLWFPYGNKSIIILQPTGKKKHTHTKKGPEWGK